jgi:hypothetical protein
LARNSWLAFFGTRRQRFEARYFLILTAAARWGFRIYNPHLIWHRDAEFIKLWARFPEATPGITERRYILLSAAQSVRNVQGDTAECGVYRGASSFLILASQEGTGKIHHIFDSFSGLSEPEKFDSIVNDEMVDQWKKNDLAAPSDIVRRNLAAYEAVQFYAGWIPERFREVEHRRFSFVHIDVDLYRPTLDSLAFFYPRMNSGGLIICDDYGFSTCPGAKTAFDEFLADKPERVIHATTGQAILVKH